MLSIKHVQDIPLRPDWNDATWLAADSARLTFVHPRSSSHVPEVHFKLLWDEASIAVQFLVRDRYVRSVCRTPQGPVCQDTCVEWFVEPVPGKGYFNFELNAGGCLHVSFIEDPARRPGGGFAKYQFPDAEKVAWIDCMTSLPPVIEPEISEPVTWQALIGVPFRFFQAMLGEAWRDIRPGTVWRSNFYKCGDQTSHPHWLSWNPVGELNFHRPEDFAPLVFA